MSLGLLLFLPSIFYTYGPRTDKAMALFIARCKNMGMDHFLAATTGNRAEVFLEQLSDFPNDISCLLCRSRFAVYQYCFSILVKVLEANV